MATAKLADLQSKKRALEKELRNLDDAIEEAKADAERERKAPWRELGERVKLALGKPFANGGHVALLMIAYHDDGSWGYVRGPSGIASIARPYSPGWMSCASVEIKDGFVTCMSQNREFCTSLDMKARVDRLTLVDEAERVASHLRDKFGPTTRDENGFSDMHKLTPSSAAEVLQRALDRECAVEDCMLTAAL